MKARIQRKKKLYVGYLCMDMENKQKKMARKKIAYTYSMCVCVSEFHQVKMNRVN